MPPCPRQDTRFIPTCCAESRSPGLIKRGLWTSAISPWHAASSIWQRLSIGLADACWLRSEEHTSELQSLRHLVCRLLLGKKLRSQEDTSALQSLTHLARRLLTSNNL